MRNDASVVLRIVIVGCRAWGDASSGLAGRVCMLVEARLARGRGLRSVEVSQQGRVRSIGMGTSRTAATVEHSRLLDGERVGTAEIA